jgi:hypothetical protein
MRPVNGDREPPRAPDPEDPLVRSLARAAALERDVVAEARRTAPSTEELRAVEAALDRATRPDRRVPRVRVLLVVAALVVATLLAWRLFPRETPALPRGVTLGANELQILAPEGPVDAFTELRWRTATSGAPRFDVRVVDDATGELLLRVRDLQALELLLENQDTSAWNRIRVEVDELDSAGLPAKSGRTLSWRRSP